MQNEDDHIPDNGRKEGTHCGLIALNYETNNHDGIELNFRRMGLSRYTIDIVEDELELVNALVDRVREWDPEIFTGFDVLKDSWGYFVERVDEVCESSTNHGAIERDLIACTIQSLASILSQS